MWTDTMYNNDDRYRDYLEERKVESFDAIMDIYLDQDLNWNKRMSMIADVLMEYRCSYVHDR